MRIDLRNWRLFIAAGAFIAVNAFFFGLGGTVQNAQTGNSRPSMFAKFASADAVTRDIRDASREIVRIDIKNPSDIGRAARFGRIVENYGSFVVLSKKKSADLSRSGLEIQRIDATVNLPSGKFDPTITPPSETISPESTTPEGGYYIMQFGSIVTDEWLDSLRDEGVEILQYAANQAFYVYGSGEAIAKAARHSRVRWVGKFTREQKISTVLADQLSASPPTGISPLELTDKGWAAFDIAVFARADIDQIAGMIGGSMQGSRARIIRLPNNFFNIVRVELPLDQVAKVAGIPDVVRIDAYGTPKAEDERAAQIVAGNYTSTTVISGPGYNPLMQFGVDGTNVTVSMVDDGVSIPGNGGFYITSANTVNGPLRGAAAGATGGHGHLNASIIAGSTPFGTLDPTGYNYGLGVAPKSNIINIPLLTSSYTGVEADTYSDTVITNGPNGVAGSISNNSWGNGTNSNAYDSYTAQFDGFVRDASSAATIDPISLIFSAGNCGNAPSGSTCNSQNGLTRPKVAKNLIAVGNSANLRTELSPSANNIDDLTSSSSRGPAADGRVKPDIVAPGSYITGGRAGSCGTVTSCFDANHAYSIGTSHAAPQVAGAAALFTQFWKNGHGGQNPSPAMIKAAILNTGQEMSGVNTSGETLPNGNEGWGRINMKQMLSTVPTLRIDQTWPISTPGTAIGTIGKVADSTKPVRVTLVWTDPPAAADPALVNNLDLQVNVGGNFYRGNVFSGGVSTTGGSGDTVNNVENVWLPAGIPVGTTFSVSVSAVALNGDGILGNADLTDQNFAVVAYNFQSLTAPRAPFDFDGDQKTDISIFRPAPAEWWYQRSSDSGVFAAQFGSATDKLAPADFTGDGKADIAFFRPSAGQWFILRSEDSSFFAFPFGAPGDIPAPADFDGDGKSDAAVFRQSNATWYVLRSSDGGVITAPFGITTDQPVAADYDGDGKADFGVWRASPGEWWILKSSGGVSALQFGSATDKAVPGDYTGDGKADVAFWRPATGFWYVVRSEDFSFFAFPFGAGGDVPTPGDYDGDGKYDAAVFRPNGAIWFINRSTAGVLIQQFGATGDQPLPGAYVR